MAANYTPPYGGDPDTPWDSLNMTWESALFTWDWACDTAWDLLTMTWDNALFTWDLPPVTPPPTSSSVRLPPRWNQRMRW